MFFLRDLPDDTIFDDFRKRYPDIDVSALRPYLHLLRTGSDMLTAAESMFARHGLSLGRFCALIVALRHPDTPIGISDLAEKVGVSRATMTGLLDGLERDGLMERHPDPQDRRRIEVRLTPRGRRSIEGVLPDYYARVGALMRALSESERQALVLLLDKIAAHRDAIEAP